MKTKWDIVENVVSAHSEDSVSGPVRRKARSIVSDALATTVFAGTLLLPVFALGAAVDVAQTGVFASTQADTPFMSLKSKFVRPRPNRANMAEASVDVAVGLSTRRLAELHSKLFRPDDTDYAELSGEYSFL